MQRADPLWLPWVHPDVAARLLADPAPAAGRSWREPAVVLFVDVSGFTAMAEALGQQGLVGAETLTLALNGLLAPVVAVLERRGGHIARFAGDAATVVFPARDRPRDAARSALAAAFELQAFVAANANLVTMSGTFPLGLKCGLDVGEVLTLVVGRDRLEVVVAGPPVDGAAEAEHLAASGDIVASVAVARLAGSDEVPWHGFVKAHGPVEAPLPASSPPLPLGADHPDGWRFLHPLVAERVRTGQDRFLGEHRPVSVLFARLPPLPLAEAELGAVLERALGVLARFDATLDKVDCGDKGAKVIALLGAPLSRADDADRAIGCALALAAELGAGVGVHRGMTFCGAVGAPSRREYTAMGEVVNLAARLMQRAVGGEVLASRSALGPDNRRYDATGLGGLPFKGLREPVETVRVERVRHGRFERARDNVLVGRDVELAVIDDALASARRGRGRALLFVGDAGIGKSRLGAEAAERARAAGFAVHAGVADDRLAGVAFHAWREVLADLFGDVDGLRDALAAVGHAPAADVLAAALGWTLTRPGGVGTTEDGRLRAIGAALGALAAGDPTARLLVLDDAQWFDAASVEVLRVLARRLGRSRWVALVLARAAPGDPTVRLPPAEHTAVHALGALSAGETGRLVAHHLGVDTVSDEVAERAAQQTGGNPLHVAELVAHARSRGLELHALDLLPASLRALVASRLDALTEADRVVLRAAAVVGVRFDPATVAAYFPDAGDELRVHRRVDDLAARSLFTREGAGARFAHRLTHQVVYEALSATARGELHGRLSDHLAAVGAEPWLVAHHARHSGDPARIVARVPAAAARAEATFAHDEAATWWESLLPFVAERHRDSVLVGVGRNRMLGGRVAEAVAALEASLRLSSSEGDRETELEVRMWLQDLHLQRGRAAEAEVHLARAEALAGELEGFSDAPWVASARVQLLSFTGRGPEAITLARAALADAEPRGHRQVPALLGMLGAALERTDPEAAVPVLERAAALAEAAGNLKLAGRTVGNLGIALRRVGRFAEAAAASARNIDLARRAADVRGLSIAIGNEGVVRYYAGDFEGSLCCLACHLELVVDLDDARSVAIAMSNLGSALLMLGRDALARRYHDAGQERFAAIGLSAEALGWAVVGARLAEREGRWSAALAAFEALAASDHPAARDRGTTALSRCRVRLRAGLPTPEVPSDGTTYAAWCAAPTDERLRDAALAESLAAWRRGDLEGTMRLADLGSRPPAPAPQPLPEGVSAVVDLEDLLARLTALPQPV
jgi:class 3 adenylate cyclase/tetratricopeptide (TPR) repeat protein